MNYVIMDASVILKWVFVEPYQDEAESYLYSENIDCITPDFALVECAGAIRRKISRNEISQAQGEIGYTQLLNLQSLKFFPSQNHLTRAFYLANHIKHDFYDCIYLAIAEHLNTVMVTADRKFYDQVKLNETFKNFIHWIEDPIED